MSVNAAIWSLSFYVLIYYCTARWVMFELARTDPDYFEPGEEAFGMKHSAAMWNMLMDSELPGNFGPKIKYGIYIARAMLILYIPVFILAFAI